MRRLRFSWLGLTAGAVTIASAFAAMASTGDTPDADSFKAIYSSLAAPPGGRESELTKTGDAAAKKQKFAAATAAYLAAARGQLISNNFEIARTSLDKAFLMAAKLSPADQRETLSTLSGIVGQCHGQMSQDAYKYLAQQRLKLLRSLPGSSADSKYGELQRVAFACSAHERYQEAISLLLETLKDLQTIQPAPENIGWCEGALARIYNQSGDTANAKKYYELWVKFARGLRRNAQLNSALIQYLHFLFDHHMTEQAVSISEEFLQVSLSPEQVNYQDRVSFAYLARELSGIDANEADKFYREAFNNQKKLTESAMNIGYGHTITEWAEMLSKAGKTKEALAVLNEGMDFCRHSKWPDAIERSMPEMETEYEKVLASAGDSKSVSEAQAKFQSELSSSKEKQKVQQEQKLRAAIDNSQTKPLEKVRALTELSNKEFESKQCDDGAAHLKDAVAVYEKNAADKTSEQMLSCFTDVRIHLNQCERDQESEPLLLRIIDAALINGFKDPLAATSWESSCGFGRIPVEALDDYLGSGQRIGTMQLGSQGHTKLEQLLVKAKAMHNPSSVVFFLLKLHNPGGSEQNQIDAAEELEVWRAQEDNPRVLLFSMHQTADLYLRYKRYDSALSKWAAAKSINDHAHWDKKHLPVSSRELAMSSASFGEKLFASGQSKPAGQLFLDAYKYASQEGRDHQIATARERLKLFAIETAKSGDAQTGKEVLTEGQNMAQAKF